MPRRAEAVYAYIATHPGVTDEELVAALHLPSRAAVAAVARRLEESGRIERRKEGRIVRNLVRSPAAERPPEDVPRALAPRADSAIARGTDIGLVALSPVFSVPKVLRRPGSLVLRVDVDPRRDQPGAFAGACVSFDGARLSFHLRAAVPDVTSTPVTHFARTLRAAGKRAAVTLRLLPRLPDDGLFPAIPERTTANGFEPVRTWRRTVE